MDVNLNAAECIKSQQNFGETAYHNICSGAIEIVPWGTMDWVAISFTTLMGITICAIIWKVHQSTKL